MRPISIRVAALASAALLAGGLSTSVDAAVEAASPAASTVPGAERSAVPTIGPGLAEDVAALAPGGRIDVIVAAHEAGGLGALDELGIAARRLRSAPVALARLTASDVSRLAGDSRIRSLWPRQSYDLFLDRTTQIVGADRVQQRLAIDGEGVAVAVIDTGIDTTHPDLPRPGKVVANYEVAADPFDLAGDLLVDLPDTDDDGHGTHVASTVAGNDADGGHVHDGVAPGAQLYGYSVNVSLTIDIARALAAFDDIIQKRVSGVPIVAISNSWGGGPGEYDPDDPLSILVKAAFDEDITVVFAAGNSGQDGGALDNASDQCTMPWVVCVGANTDPGQLVQFSSRGRPPVPTTVTMPDGEEYDIPAGNHDRSLGQQLGIGVFRPTVSAPGVNVVAACATAASNSCDAPNGYVSLSGTSMSTPHVSGVVALVNAAAGVPNLTANAVVDTLEATATPMPGWQVWEAGAGAVDAYRAVQAVQSGSLHAPANLGAVPRPLGEGATQVVSDVTDPANSTTRLNVDEHEIEVPAGTDRLDLELTWENPDDNLYMFAWRPGADRQGDDATRADQESWGLLEGLGPRQKTFRLGTIPAPQAGTWTVRVVARIGDSVPYTLAATTRRASRPAVDITHARFTSADAKLKGTVAFPEAVVGGVTRTAVAGTQPPLSDPGTPTKFWLRGDVPEGDKHLDFWFGIPGPTMDDEEPTDPVPSSQSGGWYGNDVFAGNPLLAYWRAPLQATIRGDVSLELWLSAPTMSLGGQVTVTLFDVPSGSVGTKEIVPSMVTIARKTVSGAGIGPIPTLLEATIPNVLHTLGPDRDLIVQLSTTFVDVGYFNAWYDSGEFDANVTLPLSSDAPSASALPSAPAGLTSTSLTEGRVLLGWEASTGATGYTVYRSASPTEPGNAIGTTSATTFLDTGRTAAEPVYYRVAAVTPAGTGDPSLVVVGTPVDARRWVEVRAGHGPWELVTSPSPVRWRTTIPFATGPAADRSTFTARAHDYAGASTEESVRASG